MAQQEPQPPDEEAEVVTGGGKHGVGGVAGAVGEIIAAHAVLFLEMADDGLDGGSPSHLALDLGRDLQTKSAPNSVTFETAPTIISASPLGTARARIGES